MFFKIIFSFSFTSRFFSSKLTLKSGKASIRLELSKKFGVQISVYHGFVLPYPVLKITIDAITECVRKELINEISYANYLVLIRKSWKILNK